LLHLLPAAEDHSCSQFLNWLPQKSTGFLHFKFKSLHIAEKQHTEWCAVFLAE